MPRQDYRYTVKPEHVAAIRWRMRSLLGTLPGAIAAQYREQGLSPKRLRWDLLRASGVRLCDENTMPSTAQCVLSHEGAYTDGRGAYFVPVYGYADDDHVDSVLRGVMRNQAEEWNLESWKWAAKRR